MNELICTHDLSIGYRDKVVQHRLNLSARSGTMIALLGQNGCGKSTLLRTLAGLQPALSGDILLSQKPLSKLSQQEKAKQLALVLTENHSVGQTLVRDIVAMGRYPYTSFLGNLLKTDNQAIDEALLKVGMCDKQHKFFNQLSDGEKQRTLIAKALAQQTPVILLDEPTAHLDLPNKIKTMMLLKELAQTQNKLIIISTHELDLAQQTADLIWLMTAYKGVAVGTKEELTRSKAFNLAFPDLPQKWQDMLFGSADRADRQSR